MSTPALTPQERRILVHKANGLTNRMISQKMGIRPDSISTKLTRIYKRLSVDNGCQAVAVALKLEIIRPDQILCPPDIRDTAA